MENADAMPLPAILAIAGFFTVIVAIAVVVARALARSYRPVGEERSRADRLQVNGVRVEASVTAWAKHPGGGEEAPAMRLHARFPFRGSSHDAELVVRIDRALVAGFSPGSTVHLLVDPADPGDVAIDRSRSPVELPRSR